MRKSKDYTIFKIRYYADGINIHKGVFGDNDNIRQAEQHRKRVNDYLSFFWQMVEKVTSRSFKHWLLKYFLSSSECAIEELFAEYDILIPNSEEYYYWFIPKHMTELIQWVKENCNLPFKIVTRCEYSSCLNKDKTDWKRKGAEEFIKKHLPNVL